MTRTPIMKVFRKLIGKSVVQVAAINAFSGVGFAGANLILAWVLTSTQYGLVALVIALANIGIGIGPLGLTGVVNRQLVRADGKLLLYGFIAALLTATGMTWFAYSKYELPLPIITLMAVAIIAGALTQLAAAEFQVKQRFVIATCLGNFGNLGLAITSVIVWIAAIESPTLPLFLIAITFFAAAAASWSSLLREQNINARQVHWHDGSDAISMAGLAAAAQILVQLERLVIPEFISLEALATFGVMAALVIAPYRSLELAVAFTLLPRLRATDEPGARRRMVRKETVFVTILCSGGGAILWLLALPVTEWIYGDRYPVTAGLILAGIIGGTVKVASSLCRSLAIAFCTTRELWALAWASWVAVALSIAGAWFGSDWGLPGIVYGASLGFIARAVASLWIAAKYYITMPIGTRGAVGS